jgi:SAM-dependent methyltransferase
MKKMDTYWIDLWRDMAEAFSMESRQADVWKGRAKKFDAAVKRKASQPDPLRDFVLSKIDSGSTVLDIGAGTGSWALPLARIAGHVTAIEPSQAMAGVLQYNLQTEGLANVHIVHSRWEEAEVEPHDIALCSHGMYASPDLLGFVRKMEQKAIKLRFLLMRVPSHDGVLGEIARRLYGHSHDSPNFVVAYNALLSAGICASAMVEPTMRPWTNDSLDAALQRVRDHLRLGDDHSWDEQIRSLLEEKLELRKGLYYWPDGMRSALIWW